VIYLFRALSVIEKKERTRCTIGERRLGGGGQVISGLVTDESIKGGDI